MKPTSAALIYTILVDGKPVVALETRGREAAELCREEWFRSDLCALSSNGEAVCGIGSKLQARRAIELRRAVRWSVARWQAEHLAAAKHCWPPLSNPDDWFFASHRARANGHPHHLPAWIPRVRGDDGPISRRRHGRSPPDHLIPHGRSRLRYLGLAA